MPKVAATPGRTAVRRRPGTTDRFGEQRPVLEVVGVDVVGRVELVGRAPDHDLATDLDVEARQRVDERDISRVALDMKRSQQPLAR
jgi:hypothetical protein